MYSLAIDNDTVWVGGKTALFKLDLEGKLIKKYTIEDGLPAGPYYSITIDKQIKWVATDKGIFSVCGNSISVIVSANGESLDSVTVIKSDKFGNVWFGTKNNGLWKYDKTSFTNFNSENSNILIDRIDALTVHNDTVWVGGKNISFYANNAWTNTGWFTYNGVKGIAINKNGFVCYATKNIVYVLQQSAVTTSGYGLQYDVTGLFELNDGQVWVSNQSFTLDISETMSNGRYINYQQHLKSAGYDKNGRLWTLMEIVGVRLQKENGLTSNLNLYDDQICSNTVSCIAKDNKDNLWIGSNAGLSFYNGSNWKHYYKDNGLIHDTVKSILPLTNGDVWVGTYNGISKIDTNGIISYKNADNVLCALNDSLGNIWFGTATMGILQYNGTSWIRHSITSSQVYSLYLDKDNVIMAGTQHGLYSYKSNQWSKRQYNLISENSAIKGLTADTSGALWCVGDKWLYNTVKGTYQSLNIETIKTAIFDSLNNLWLTTDGLMLYKYDGKNLIKLPVSWGATALPVIVGNKFVLGSNSGVKSMPVTCMPDDESGSINANELICEGDNINLILVKQKYSNPYSVLWTLPGEVPFYTLNSNITSTIKPKSGIIKAQYMNVCGAQEEVQKEIKVEKYPSQLEGLTGKIRVCAGEQGIQFSVNPDSLSTSYFWALPYGMNGSSTTNTIKVNVTDTAKAGRLVVAGRNKCGSGLFLIQNLVVEKNTPVIDSMIGSSIICSNESNLKYYISTKDTGIIYNWVLPDGASGTISGNEAYVNFAPTFSNGTIKAVASNGCGNTERQITLVKSNFSPATIVKKWDNLLICKDSANAFKNTMWYCDGNLLSNLQNKKYFIAQTNGNYKVVASTMDGCSDSAQFSFVVPHNAKAYVSPNPFLNSFRINLNTNETGKVQITLLNSNGVKIKDLVFNKEDNSSIFDLNTSDILPGLYILQININNTSFSNLRVLKK